jgi:ABC-type sugar transport system ATPase subunit
MGRAIVRSPKVFLFDEPLSNLDAKLRGQTRVELQKRHRDQHTTFICVTHDHVEGMTMSDRMRCGQKGPIRLLVHPADFDPTQFQQPRGR